MRPRPDLECAERNVGRFAIPAGRILACSQSSLTRSMWHEMATGVLQIHPELLKFKTKFGGLFDFAALAVPFAALAVPIAVAIVGGAGTDQAGGSASGIALAAFDLHTRGRTEPKMVVRVPQAGRFVGYDGDRIAVLECFSSGRADDSAL